MTEIVFQLEDSSCIIKYYCIIEFNKLYVVSSKSLEKRVFWNEFKDYEIRNRKIIRVNNYKDNVLTRLLGFSEKSQRNFESESGIGVSDFDYFSTGNVCISIQRFYQEGLDYTCDFVACCTDTINLFNFYSSIKLDSLIWGTSPYHLRGRCLLSYLKEIKFNYFISFDYVFRNNDYMYISDKDVFDKFLNYQRDWGMLHNEVLYCK